MNLVTNLVTKLVTNCPWCGVDGVYAAAPGQRGMDFRNGTMNMHAEKIGLAEARESLATAIKAVSKGTERISELELVLFLCLSGCGRLTRNPSRVAMLLNRVLHGHAGSARGRMQSIEAAS